MEELKKVAEEVKELLESYKYSYECYYETNAIEEVIYEWYENKEGLISLFEKHPNYNGRYQIVLDDTYQRGIDTQTVLNELSEMQFGLSNLSTEEIDDHIIAVAGLIKVVMRACENNTIESLVTQDMVDKLKELHIDSIADELHIGAKLSRALRKYLTTTPLKDMSWFERSYAKLSDALNPLEVKRYTILSVHPYDYYTMSFGNTWSSCHTIDKTNMRASGGDGYQGCYSSGTESYMLDKVSVVMYTIDKKSDISRPEIHDKITRQMLHIGDEFFIQGRLYPQSNDGDNWEYKQMREIAQRVIAQCKNIPNYWKNKKGTVNCESVASSIGTHYRDYLNFSSCNVSFTLKESYKRIVIGHNPICPNCGVEHERQSNIMCCNCSKSDTCCYCGNEISDGDDEAISIGDRIYCCDSCAYDAGAVYIEDYGYAFPDDDGVHFDDYYEEYFYDPYGDYICTADGHVYMSDSVAEDAGYRYVESEGEWYSEEEVYYCEECGRYYLESDYDLDNQCCLECAKEGNEDE